MWSDIKICYTTITDVRDFSFWAGAKDRMDNASSKQRDAVYERILYFCECFSLCKGDYPTETDINDLVWFDCDDIFYPDESEE